MTQPYGIPPLTRDDVDHLNLLRIGFFVVAGMTALFGLFPLLYTAFGVMVLGGFFQAHAAKGPPPPEFVGWLLLVGGSLFTVWLEAVAVTSFLAGRALGARKNRTFVMIVGALHLPHAPLGTLLGIFTILILSRPSVRATFEAAERGGRQ